HLHDQTIAEDLEGRAVGGAGHLVTPVVERAGDEERPAIEAADSLQPAKALVPSLFLRETNRLQSAELLDSPLPPSQGCELLAQERGEGDQMTRVGGRVLQHVARQRAAGPVGALMRLVEFLVEVLLQQRGQTEGLVSEELGGD